MSGAVAPPVAWGWRAQGDANHYVILRPDGGWLAAVQMNGEMLPSKQEEGLRRMVASLQPYEQLPIEFINQLPEAAGFWPMGLNDRIVRLCRAVERAAIAKATGSAS